MTRYDLIERLARSEAERKERYPEVTWSWDDDEMAEFRDAWRRNVAPVVPVVVEFVAEWIEKGHIYIGLDSEQIAAAWREEMGE